MRPPLALCRRWSNLGTGVPRDRSPGHCSNRHFGTPKIGCSWFRTGYTPIVQATFDMVHSEVYRRRYVGRGHNQGLVRDLRR